MKILVLTFFITTVFAQTITMPLLNDGDKISYKSDKNKIDNEVIYHGKTLVFHDKNDAKNTTTVTMAHYSNVEGLLKIVIPKEKQLQSGDTFTYKVKDSEFEVTVTYYPPKKIKTSTIEGKGDLGTSEMAFFGYEVGISDIRNAINTALLKRSDKKAGESENPAVNDQGAGMPLKETHEHSNDIPTVVIPSSVSEQ